MRIVIPMMIGLVLILIDGILLKIPAIREKAEDNFKIKFILTWSFVVGLVLWLCGIVFTLCYVLGGKN